MIMKSEKSNALRVFPAETWLTVYRRLRVIYTGKYPWSSKLLFEQELYESFYESRSDAGLPMIIPDASRSFWFTQILILKKCHFDHPNSGQYMMNFSHCREDLEL